MYVAQELPLNGDRFDDHERTNYGFRRDWIRQNSSNSKYSKCVEMSTQSKPGAIVHVHLMCEMSIVFVY